MLADLDAFLFPIFASADDLELGKNSATSSIALQNVAECAFTCAMLFLISDALSDFLSESSCFLAQFQEFCARWLLLGALSDFMHASHKFSTGAQIAN